MPAPPQRIGRYEIRGKLGRGAMGVVYVGYDSVLERTIALKTHHTSFGANDQLRRRFVAEIKTSSRLNHPGIVTVYDAGVETDVPFIAMELIEGTTLQAILDARGKLPAEEALAILAPIGDALAYAHRQQIVHRDVKPANIFIPADGQPKIGDFGIAKALGANAAATTMLLGTPSHMAPEQVSGAAIDHRVDVFALGVVAYETLTGRAPFQGNGLPQIALAVTSYEPPPPSALEPSLPKAVDGVIARALAKDPARRTADTDVFVRELQSALSGDPVETIPVSPKNIPRVFAGLPSRWPSVQTWSAAGLVAANLLLGVAWMRPAPERPPVKDESFVRLKAPPRVLREEPIVPAALAEPSTDVAPELVPAALAPKAESDRRPPREARETFDGTGRPAQARLAPRPPASVVVGQAALAIVSEPPGAAVLVNGEPRGAAPVELEGLASGSYEVTVEFPGVDPQTRTVNVAAGRRHHTITFRLAPDPL